MTGEKGMFLRDVADFANFARDEGGGVASLTAHEYEKVLDLVAQTLREENIHLNYGESKTNDPEFPVSLKFKPETMATRIVHLLNSHPANFY